MFGNFRSCERFVGKRMENYNAASVMRQLAQLAAIYTKSEKNDENENLRIDRDSLVCVLCESVLFHNRRKIKMFLNDTVGFSATVF